MSSSWHGWYHAVANTYGTWLPGDLRGWRSRGHRVHVDGDYKRPPPEGAYDALHARSKRLMKTGAVVLTQEMRETVCDALVEKLRAMGVEVARLSVGGCHCHCLMRIQSPRMAMRGLCEGNMLTDGRNPLPRHVLGVARKHASHVLRQRGLKAPGALWAKRPKVVVVESEGHFEYLRDIYIPNHAREGAVVWPSTVDAH